MTDYTNIKMSVLEYLSECKKYSKCVRKKKDSKYVYQKINIRMGEL